MSRGLRKSYIELGGFNDLPGKSRVENHFQRRNGAYPQQRGSISWGLSSNGENLAVPHAQMR